MIFGVRKRDRFWGGDFAKNHKVLRKNTLGFEKKKSKPAIRREVFGVQFQSRFRGSESTADLVLDFIPRKCNEFATPLSAHAFKNGGDFPTRFRGQ